MLNLKHKYYRLISITDRQGNDKSTSKDLYIERIRCIANNIRYDIYNRIYIDFFEDADGNPVVMHLHTSVVEDLTETEDKLTITTTYSVYIFEKAEPAPVTYQEDANLIELYFSGDGHKFAKVFFYDDSATPYELGVGFNIGMFTDTALVKIADPDCPFRGTVCRYYLTDNPCVEFYDTLYHQQEYNTPMLIHNVGDVPLCIKFEMFSNQQWMIAPGGSERIIPPIHNN